MIFSVFALILVDKATKTLEIAEYHQKGYKVLRSFKATVGQVDGDKMEEGDLKTPEGIYQFSMKLRPPQLKPKFGELAFYINYPNRFDQLAGRNGFDIMLHGTNRPERLQYAFDSEGCVVVSNEDLHVIEPSIQLRNTPILIFEQLTSDYRIPEKHQSLIDFIENWRVAWENKNLDAYIGSYHSHFTNDGRNLPAYKTHKKNLNNTYETIKVSLSDLEYYPHPKYALVRFVQQYQSFFVHGKPGHHSTGRKSLLVAKEDGQLKILEERYD